ncbi:MAG: nicotinamide mononucleotide transporter, partial [Acidimicrobiales bacterium]
MPSLELVAVVVTLIAVFLTARQIVWCWPLAMVSVTLYAVVFFRAKLYADMGLQALYFG